MCASTYTSLHFHRTDSVDETFDVVTRHLTSHVPD